MVIGGVGANAGNVLIVNQNGQVFIVNPVGGAGGGPAIVGQINLPNSPLYVVPNGKPGVYVICCTGGTVHIVDTNGGGNPTISGSYNFPGEHTGPPTMTTDAAGNCHVEIPTTSGVYEINKGGPPPAPPAPGPARPIPEDQLGGHLACVAAVAMAGTATPGDMVLASVDTELMGEQTASAGAIVAVLDSASGDIIQEEHLPEEPYISEYFLPDDTAPGATFTFTATLSDESDDGSEVVGEGATPLVVLSPIAVESLLEASLSGAPGEVFTLVYALDNIGIFPDTYALDAVDTLGWPLELSVPEISLAPGEQAVAEITLMIPDGFEPGEYNDVTLSATSMSSADWYGSDWAAVQVAMEDEDTQPPAMSIE